MEFGVAAREMHAAQNDIIAIRSYHTLPLKCKTLCKCFSSNLLPYAHKLSTV